MDLEAKALALAIRQVESGGVAKTGASGELRSLYQFMPSTWKTLAKKHLGSEDANLTRENENRVAYNEIVYYKKQGKTPAEIASIWNSGKPTWKGNVGINKQGVRFDTPAYVRKVYQEYQKQKRRLTGGYDAHEAGTP